MGENIHVDNLQIESNGRKNQVNPLDIAETMRILRVELQSCKEDNEKSIRYQEEHNQLNAIIIQIFKKIEEDSPWESLRK